MKKKKIFINKLDKKINNNQNYCDVKNENTKENIIEKKDDKSVLDKIDKLFNTNGYIFNIDVTIITTEHEYHTKIASKINNYLVTLDNDIISIDDIKDIIVHK